MFKNTFGVRNPVLVSDINIGNLTKIMKMISLNNEYSCFTRKSEKIPKVIKKESDIILIPNNVEEAVEDLNVLKDNSGKILVIMKKPFKEDFLKKSDIGIGQEVYFMNEAQNEVFENYQVNGQNIKRNLGYFDVNHTEFIWTSGVDSSFVRRRSNFQGLVLKGMIENSRVATRIHKNYKMDAPYFPSNETYFMNNHVRGLFIDVLEILEERLNFTTMLYKRKEYSFGYVKELPNGTLKGIGMFGDVYHGRADFIATSLDMTLSRIDYIDYFPPLFTNIRGIFIPVTASTEGVLYDFFLRPLEFNLWIVTLTCILLVACIKFWIGQSINETSSASMILASGLHFFWTSFIAIFGGKPQAEKLLDSIHSFRMVIFTSLLSGLIIWIHFRAFLSASFQVSTQLLPFNDLDSFAASDWR